MGRPVTVAVLAIGRYNHATCRAAVVMPGSRRGRSGLTADALKGLELRSIGPTIATGRIADIAIDPKNPSVWYIASAFGGLWKTTNRGISFEPIFHNATSFTLCCVVVDPRDSNTVWLGTGENASQRSAHFGDGVYKSIDGGKTWKTLTGGLPKGDMGRVGLAIDGRKTPATVFALVDAKRDEAGFYRSDDAGATWTPIGHMPPQAGARGALGGQGAPGAAAARGAAGAQAGAAMAARRSSRPAGTRPHSANLSVTW